MKQSEPWSSIYSHGYHVFTLSHPLHRRWNGGILDSTRCLSVRPSVLPSVRPSVDKVSGFFLKNYRLNSFYTWNLSLWGWVSWSLFIFVFLVSFLALGWPNIWPKMGFPEFFLKTIGSIHFIPGIYPYWVSFLTPIHFRVPSLILGPLVAKYLAENGISVTFWNFLDEVGSDQSGGILSPFMGTACWLCIYPGGHTRHMKFWILSWIWSWR